MDTATAATAVALERGDGAMFEARHDPAAGERPGHAGHLLGLIEEALAAADVGLADVGRLAVGTGPGSDTGCADCQPRIRRHHSASRPASQPIRS